jgi:homopolymeric O-antigen transport system ATP-binding protein
VSFRGGDAVIVEQLNKSYNARNLQKQALVENLFRKMLGIQPKRADIHALKNISFRVKAGESLGIVGGNGAGKSTLLKMIAGIATPSSGTVEVRARISTQLALGSGFHPFMTGRENIYLQGSILGMTNRQIRELMPTVIAFAGIEEAVDRQLWTYSTGMMSRLGFAIAAHVDFEVLLLDEALSAGDRAFRERCTETLLKFRASGATMIIVSHGSENLSKLCDRILWLDRGEIRALGPTAEILSRYEDAGPRRVAPDENRGAQSR